MFTPQGLRNVGRTFLFAARGHLPANRNVYATRFAQRGANILVCRAGPSARKQECLRHKICAEFKPRRHLSIGVSGGGDREAQNWELEGYRDYPVRAGGRVGTFRSRTPWYNGRKSR